MEQEKNDQIFSEKINLEEIDRFINLIDPNGEVFEKTKILLKEENMDNSIKDYNTSSIVDTYNE